MLAVYYWIRYWHPYIWGTKFKIYTDHSPLIGIKTKKDVSRRLSRMILNLQEYDFEMYYTPGKKNVVADAMSRTPLSDYECVYIKRVAEMINCTMENVPEDTKMEIHINELVQNLTAFLMDAKADGHLAPVIMEHTKEMAKKNISILMKRKTPLTIKSEKIAKMQLKDDTLIPYLNMAKEDKEVNNWLIHKECLHRVRSHRNWKSRTIQLVLPKQLRPQILEAYHDDLLGGHCGYLKTASKIAQWYWWPGMHKEIKKYIETCEVCQQYRRPIDNKEGKMAPIIATRIV